MCSTVVRRQERGGKTALQVHRGLGAARTSHGRTACRNYSADTTAQSSAFKRQPTTAVQRRRTGRLSSARRCRRLQKTVPTSRSRRDNVLWRSVHPMSRRAVTLDQTCGHHKPCSSRKPVILDTTSQNSKLFKMFHSCRVFHLLLFFIPFVSSKRYFRLRCSQLLTVLLFL